MFLYLIKGAVIASEAMPDKNKISTGTLTYSDIQNKADYNASSTGVSLDTKGKIPVTPVPGMPVSGDADSTTTSAISLGNIEVRSNPNQDLSKLSRDTGNSLNALGKIFDKKTVQEQQELAKVFGEEAFKAVGDLAASEYKKAAKAKDKEAMALWDDGGAYKIALHSLVGGIMSDFGGNSFTSGALSAGLNEAVQGELGKIKDPGIHQLVSAIIGAAAAKVVGGDAQVGASIAASGTKNNWLSHDQQHAFADALANAKNDNEWNTAIARFAGLSQYNFEKYGEPEEGEAIQKELSDQLPGLLYYPDAGLNYNLTKLTEYYGVSGLAGVYKDELSTPSWVQVLRNNSDAINFALLVMDPPVGVGVKTGKVIDATINETKVVGTVASDVFAAQNYKLTLIKEDVLSNSKTIIQGKDLWDPKAIEILTSNGSKIGDWAKMESDASYATTYGEGKIHYYKNAETGEISSFDCKMKISKPKQFRQFDGDDFWVVDLDSMFKPLGVR